MRTTILFGGLALTLLTTAMLVVQKERLLAEGRPVLLELAPVDPRSLIQGDYMTLAYAVSRAGWNTGRAPRDGHLVLKLDEHGVGQFVRVHDSRTALGPDELLLRYRIRDHQVRLGAEAFYFQEGHASRYEAAKYGELRVAADGTSVLVGLRDAQRAPLGGVSASASAGAVP